MKVYSLFIRMIFLYRLLRWSESWHGYKDPSNNTQNHSGNASTEPFSQSFIKRLSLWPNLMSQYDISEGKTLYGAKEVLDMIWTHQNPKNCSQALFLVAENWPNGFGSRVHIAAAGLAIAMQLNRVFLYAPFTDDRRLNTSIPFCREQNATGMDCYFHPISKCTVEDAKVSLQTRRLYATEEDTRRRLQYYKKHFRLSDQPQTSTLVQLLTRKYNTEAGLYSSLEQATASHKSLYLTFTSTGTSNLYAKYFHVLHGHLIPDCVLAVLQDSPVRLDLSVYYWRAIAATYILRPNAHSLKYLEKFDTLPLRSERDTRRCVAMHVRHGDKTRTEMKKVKLVDYLYTAENMWKAGLIPVDSSHYQSKDLNTNTLMKKEKRIIFISSETHENLVAAAAYGKENGWTVYNRDIIWPNEHDTSNNLEYFSYLLNLMYGLRCEAWVCTLHSNTCRVIDELRVTVGAKANRHFADLSVETCHQPPCIGKGLMNWGS